MKSDNWEQQAVEPQFAWLFTGSERTEAQARTLAANAFDRRHEDVHTLAALGRSIAETYVEISTKRRPSLRAKYPDIFEHFPPGHDVLAATLDTVIEHATFGKRLPWRKRKVRPGSKFHGWIDRQWDCYYAAWIKRRIQSDLVPRLVELLDSDDRDPLLTALRIADFANISSPSAETEVLHEEHRAAVFRAVEDNKAGDLLLDLAEGAGLRQPGDTPASIRAKQRTVKAGRQRLQKRLADQVDKRPGRVRAPTSEIAGPPYPWPDDYYHGPCYFLDPFADELGERIELKTVEPTRKDGWHRTYPQSQPKRRERRPARPYPLTFGYVGEARRGHGPDSDEVDYISGSDNRQYDSFGHTVELDFRRPQFERQSDEYTGVKSTETT